MEPALLRNETEVAKDFCRCRLDRGFDDHPICREPFRSLSSVLLSRCGIAAPGTENKGPEPSAACPVPNSNSGYWPECQKLAAAAKVSPETVVRFERGETLCRRTVDSLRLVLEAAGLEFTDGRKPGVIWEVVGRARCACA